jgi:hypothetical protein
MQTLACLENFSVLSSNKTRGKAFVILSKKKLKKRFAILLSGYLACIVQDKWRAIPLAGHFLKRFKNLC